MAEKFVLTIHSFKKFIRVYTLKAKQKDIASLWPTKKASLTNLFDVFDELIAIKAQVCLHVVFIRTTQKSLLFAQNLK